jgi:KaiC/GvpD/RAD55 family RecA-like ATPase
MIKIKKSDKLEITPPCFKCDYNLTEHLEKYPQFSHLNKFNTTAIIGKPGMGKTSTLISILSQKGDNKIYHKVFDFVFIIMPSQSRASLAKNIFEKHHPSRLFDDLTLDTLQRIYSAIEENSSNKKTSLVVFDDVTSNLKNKDIQSLLKKMSYNRRHLKLVQMFLIQSWIAVPLTIRKLFSNLIVFKPAKLEFMKICEETIEQEEDICNALLNLYNDSHDYIFVNVTNQKMYLNQDEIEILEND